MHRWWTNFFIPPGLLSSSLCRNGYRNLLTQTYSGLHGQQKVHLLDAVNLFQLVQFYLLLNFINQAILSSEVMEKLPGDCDPCRACFKPMLSKLVIFTACTTCLALTLYQVDTMLAVRCSVQ